MEGEKKRNWILQTVLAERCILGHDLGLPVIKTSTSPIQFKREVQLFSFFVESGEVQLRSKMMKKTFQRSNNLTGSHYEKFFEIVSNFL